MSQKKPVSRKQRLAARSSDAESAAAEKPEETSATSSQPKKGRMPSAGAIRETVESVVIAFVLAFLFRTFEAEAFVIPTGSMAPTLMGRHKDLECDTCGYAFQVSASGEVDKYGNPLMTKDKFGKLTIDPIQKIEYCTCPMCRYSMNLGPTNPQGETYPSFNGDRILVSKFPYQFGDPERWDIVVFKYPGDAVTNYIKRLVGLPNEELRITHGDILTRALPKSGENPPWTIERKPPEKLLAMLQIVFDNQAMPRIIEAGWPSRWPGDAAWKTEDNQLSFQTDGPAGGEVWFHYKHRVPKPDFKERMLPNKKLRATLIYDFCAYNTKGQRGKQVKQIDGRFVNVQGGGGPTSSGENWVGDLALMCTIDVQSTDGEVLFELVEGGRNMLCRIDVATGYASLSIPGTDAAGNMARTSYGKPYELTAKTNVRGPGKYEIIFTNADDQLRLWVDGEIVLFGESDDATYYQPLDNFRNVKDGPGPIDLSPVGIGSNGAALRVADLKVYRDIYYIAADHSDTNKSTMISDKNSDKKRRHVDFSLEEDQFFMLGDNSAQSKDSRLWPGGPPEDWPGGDNLPPYVDRDLLIGKAVFIYWPHSWDEIRSLGIPFPFFPNVPRMRFVR